MAAPEIGQLELVGQVAAVSGGLGDIGRATAEALRAAGARVALGDIRPVAEAAQRMPECHYTRVDIARPAAVERWLQRVERDLGLPTLVVCTAGILEIGTVLTLKPAAWQRTLDVNLSGAFYVAQAAARRLVAAQRTGRIVIIGSWAAHAPHDDIAAYSVAKAGLRMAMKCLAVELAPYGILVNELAPGKVDAGLTAQRFAQDPARRRRSQRSVPIGELLSAADVAAGVLQLCHPANRHMAGSVLLMDGGLSALLPRK